MENTIEEQTKMEAENEKLTKQVKDHEEKVSYFEDQSKRNNLLFHDVPEQKNETWEECKVALRKILEEKLGMEEAWSESDIAIERADGVGKFTKDKIKSMVVNLRIISIEVLFLRTNQNFKDQITEFKSSSVIRLLKIEEVSNQITQLNP